jgi:uncharacterized protein (TIGR02145 family)
MTIKFLKIKWLRIFISFGVFLIPALLSSCKKDTAPSVIEYGSLTDIDSNVYKTVKIGNQWWMAENLKVIRYRNGDTIINVGSRLDSIIWNKTKTGAYYQGSIGLLYNWYAAGDPRNVAPAGWHVPTDDEWKELEMYLGMSKEEADKVNWRGTDEGNKLKIQGVGLTVWTNPTNKYEVWGTNESGFSAIGDGCVMFNGIMGQPGANYAGFWWTVSEQGNEAWYRYLDYNKPNVFRFYGPETYGFSIRCIKDGSTNK